MDFKTADLCDEFGGELEVSSYEFKSYGKKQKFYGPIETLKVFEDNVLVRKALETVPPGTLLVVDGGGSRRCALLGDRLGEIAQNRGLAGIIINGCVRDTEDLVKLDIGILALGSNPLKSNKEGKGEQGVALTFGGLTLSPGDYVYADTDGVVAAKKDVLSITL
ncbi:ribonuclease E activity regulator RraA [Mesobacillus zeae]|uniref:4-hydroxy-4-methyl-2-oxoglutarate aldolase n=1 Tax=Mesobacillus zeae TaxID=1917180 RepID=A0A398B3C8_9BACI|nr:ribonuclease E activity regulator RraA [Mesobacillus zeae]RID82450.1 RraA family protein [Mesobacillus zeae]